MRRDFIAAVRILRLPILEITEPAASTISASPTLQRCLGTQAILRSTILAAHPRRRRRTTLIGDFPSFSVRTCSSRLRVRARPAGPDPTGPIKQSLAPPPRSTALLAG